MNNENRYYVYFHRLKETNEIFYIGKGTKYRATSKHGRSIPWNELVKSNEWYSEIHEDNLSEEGACSLEVDLISKYNPRGNVQRKDIRPRKIKYKTFAEIYYYDPSSPSGLRYVSGNRQTDYRKRVADDVAGTLLSSGYYSVHYKSSNYAAHRVVWCLVNECNIHCELIDHIDRNRSNNRIENLRAVTPPTNNKNTPLKRNNKTGHIGVSFSEVVGLFVAHWTDHQRVAYSKAFSPRKYGTDLAKALAVEFRNRMTTEELGYLPNTQYVRPEVLQGFSEQQIQDMFDCELLSSNKSGITGVHHHTVRGHSFWACSSNPKTMRFSCTKYGDTLARSLAVEYKDFVEKGLSVLDLSETLQDHLNNPTSASNQTGFRNISFIGENKDQILVQVMIDYKNHTKRFDTKTLGLLPAIAASMQWRDKMKNTTNGDGHGA